MRSWEQTIVGLLQSLRLDSIKGRILVFALLATLIPSLTMGRLSYGQNKLFLTEKITGELRNVTSHTVREVDIWLKERVYDLRVFSSSYEVSENLEKVLQGQGGPNAQQGVARRRLKEYLASVREKFIHYEELLVIDPNARVVATSAEQGGPVKLPPEWMKGAKKDKAIIGEAFWDEAVHGTVMMIAVPVKSANGRFLGAMAAKLNFRAIRSILRTFSLGKRGQVYLITKNGNLILSSRFEASPSMKTMLASKTAHALFEREAVSLQYADHEGNEVVGTLKRLPQLDWAVVAEVGRQEAYAPIFRLRNLTFLIVSALLLGIGLTAYFLGTTIVRPLGVLTHGAAKVASGDLEVDLPVATRGEVGYMTEVFNHMVARLRHGREELDSINKTLSEKNRELEALSVTDGLTGLYNRSHLMQTLTNEVARARRHMHPFSILMIDIDHFKVYNDSFGHLAGDAVLSKLASIFTKSIRSVEYAARYGGEEFLIMLPETEPDGALEAAERIRTRVAEETFGDGNHRGSVTVSIGVAAFPEHGTNAESIISSADAAMYQAKREGRNRVMRANNGQ